MVSSLLLLSLLPFALAGVVQRTDLVLPASAAAHRDAAEKIFTDSYAAYKQYAFGHDDVSPIAQSFSDGRNGWGATIVDAMSTMQVMGLDDLFLEAVNFSSQIDFSKYLGGLLSAYELSDQQHPALLEKAIQLGDKLRFAWHGDSDMPYGFIDFSTNTPTIDTSNIAEAGTLALEWQTLSKLSGNDSYREIAERSLRHIATLPPPLPGLAAQGIDPGNGQFVGSYVTWGGGSDSYFEYLIKYARYTNTDLTVYAQTWATAVDTSITKLMQKVDGWTYLGDQNNQGQFVPVSSHLACFHGGNWLFGGKLLDNDTIVQHGLDLVDACWNTYASTATGIGPEVFRWVPPGGNTSSLSSDQLAFFNAHGFYITGSDYILRPEVLESNFYAWRVTGDTKYLDRAASAIDSFNKWLTSPDFKGYLGIPDVNAPNDTFFDDEESFWFAEVLKYLYLTFDDPTHISLNDYVFNTECHPFKAPPAKATYNTGVLNAKSTTAGFKTVPGALPEVSSAALLPTPIAQLVRTGPGSK